MNDITVENEIKMIHDIQDDKEMFDAQMISNLKKRIAELEAENHKARELIDDLIQAALNDCVESIEWGEVEERARAFLINQSEEGKDD